MDAVDMEIDVPLQREDSSANDTGIPEAERSAKRPRLSENEENDGSPQESSAIALPPEVWARVMERKLYHICFWRSFCWYLLMVTCFGA